MGFVNALNALIGFNNPDHHRLGYPHILLSKSSFLVQPWAFRPHLNYVVGVGGSSCVAAGPGHGPF